MRESGDGDGKDGEENRSVERAVVYIIVRARSPFAAVSCTARSHVERRRRREQGYRVNRTYRVGGNTTRR